VDCIFCQIVQKNTPAKLVYEDDQVIAFKDIHPKAPIHLLVIPKKHLVSLAEATSQDVELLGHLLVVLKELADDNGLSGFKTVINTGRDGGQEVDHLHAHLLGGQKQPEL
jgi:histidine triad (HIT) family protein